MINLIFFYLLVGAFINLFVYFSEQNRLKEQFKEHISRLDKKSIEETGGQLLYLSLEFDWTAFVGGSLFWPMVLYLVFTRK